MTDDVALNKIAIIRRCLRRIDEEFRDDPERLDDITIQDSVVLNLIRACEAAIDLAMHHVADGRLGIPQSSRNAFELLHESGKIQSEIAGAMKRMVGFRNIAVHAYQELQRPILESILRERLGDFESFIAALGSAGSDPARSKE